MQGGGDIISEQDARLRELRKLAILDTPPEPEFDDFAQLAAQICMAPVALVSFVDADRQWFKARVGFAECETGLDSSICRLVVASGALIIIPDLDADPRTRDNPLVRGAPYARFYAGAPLVTSEGYQLGALCVLDTEPRPAGLTPQQQEGLQILARRVVDAVEIRRAAIRHQLAAERLDALLEAGDALRDSSDVGEMTRRAARIVGLALGASRTGYGTVDAEMEAIDIEPDWTAAGVTSIAGRHRFADYGNIREELRAGRPLVIGDVRTDPRTAADPEPMLELGIGALVNMPVRERGRVVAVFIVQAAEPREWTELELVFIRNVADRLEAAIGRLRAEERQEVLNGEISHRLKNSLAMVQAIANQTLRTAVDRELLETFNKRLHALSTAHDALLGPGLQAAELSEVIARVLAAVGANDRCRTSGPSVSLDARAALSTSLLIHELATNALKYGALSEAGEVVVTWQRDGADTRLEWREQGGPPASEPTRTGFGSRLLRAGMIGTGGAELRYENKGFSATFTAPSDQLGQA